MPILGITIPNMGRRRGSPVRSRRQTAGPEDRASLTSALFSSTQRKVLGLLFGQPDRSFFATEIIQLVGAGSGAVQRELRKLADSQLVRVSWVGNRKHFQANPESPVFEELCGLIRKTIGLVDPLRKALEPLRDRLRLALVYGSVAKARDTAASDIDLLLVSDSLSLEEIYRLLEGAERELDRKIHPTLYASEEFSRRRRERNPFLQRILEGKTILLIGALGDEQG